MTIREHRNPSVRKRRYHATREALRVTSFERQTKHKRERLATKHNLRMDYAI